MPVRFLALAERELVDGARWYEEREAGLGDDFLREVSRALDSVAASPDRYPLEEWNRSQRIVRRCPLDRFPYQLVFEVRSDDVVILAVAHYSRRPAYWRTRK